MLDLSATLKEWGLTIGLLSLAATTLVLLLVLSLREFFFWYLRLSHIFKQQEEISRKLDALEHQVRVGGVSAKAVPTPTPSPESFAASLIETPATSKKNVPLFPLNDSSAEKVSLDA